MTVKYEGDDGMCHLCAIKASDHSQNSKFGRSRWIDKCIENRWAIVPKYKRLNKKQTLKAIFIARWWCFG